MVAVVLAGHLHRQPREDHFWPRDADDAHGVSEGAPVVPVGETAQWILPRRVVAAEVPDIGNTKGSQIAQPFDAADQAERGATLCTSLIAAGVAARHEHDRDAALLFADRSRQIRTRQHVIVRMRDEQQQVGLHPLVRFLRAPGAGGLGGVVGCDRVEHEQRGERAAEQCHAPQSIWAHGRAWAQGEERWGKEEGRWDVSLRPLMLLRAHPPMRLTRTGTAGSTECRAGRSSW
jgi:hypothetical protein